jgi:hypothetical protein
MLVDIPGACRQRPPGYAAAISRCGLAWLRYEKQLGHPGIPEGLAADGVKGLLRNREAGSRISALGRDIRDRQQVNLTSDAKVLGNISKQPVALGLVLREQSGCSKHKEGRIGFRHRINLAAD